jgi:hypothetical protein
MAPSFGENIKVGCCIYDWGLGIQKSQFVNLSNQVLQNVPSVANDMGVTQKPPQSIE